MKKVLLNTLQIILKAALAVCLFVCAWYFLTPYFRTEHNAEGDGFRNMPDHTIDVVAVGSSHIQYAFDPAVFYAETGYYSYVMGSQCQPMSMTYHMLEEVLKTQSPEAAVIDVFTLLPASEVCYADGNFYVAIDEMTGRNRLEAADDIDNPELVRQYKYDFLMNHGNWKNMDVKDPGSILNYRKELDGYINFELGYVRQEPHIYTPTPLVVYTPDQKAELAEKEKAELDRVIGLCTENGITPVFVKTPCILDQENTNKLQAIWDYLDTKNVRHIDYLQKAEELSWYMNMDGDTWHNNSWGAEIITKDLAAYTKENRLVTKHAVNEEMEALCRNAMLITVKSLMSMYNIDIYRLLEEASKYPCAVAFRYLGSPKTSITERELELFRGIGITRDFVKNPYDDYYAFVINGELVQESNEAFAVQFSGSEVALTYSGIKIDGVDYDTEPGELEIYFMAENLGWLNAIGINHATRWFWELSCEGYDCPVYCGW
ncbi:MAG: hypothetical protein K6F23_10685 [Solobacterium sp.]|nr:hypothetical protein [Solobacterium sp.]